MLHDSPTSQAVLPRAVLFASWVQAVLDGRATRGAALRTVTGDDEPHRVREVPGALPGPALLPGDGEATDLPHLLDALAGSRVTALRAVLPVPGQAGELPGPAPFNAEALEAGEAVLVDVGGSSRWGIVPDVTEFGSAWEPGAWVEWRVHAVGEVPAWSTTLAQTDRELRGLLLRATEELAGLDVADWQPGGERPGLAEPDTASLPPGFTPRQLQSLTQAWRVRAIARAAEHGAPALLDGRDAARRLRVLHGLAAAATRALAAAANAPAEPVSER